GGAHAADGRPDPEHPAERLRPHLPFVREARRQRAQLQARPGVSLAQRSDDLRGRQVRSRRGAAAAGDPGEARGDGEGPDHPAPPGRRSLLPEAGRGAGAEAQDARGGAVRKEQTMWNVRSRAASVLVLGALITSCAMSDETRDQILGGVGGAAAGAAIGAVATGGNPRAIGAGAAAGAVTGWAAVKLTQYHAQKTRTAQQEAEYLGYRGQGPMLNIRDATVNPQAVQAGQPVNFAMDYAVLAPQGTSAVPVEESWVLEKDGKVLTTTSPMTQQREPGGWRTQASITVPRNAPAGSYIVKNRVSAFGTQQERIAYFNVS